jgi:transposase
LGDEVDSVVAPAPAAKQAAGVVSPLEQVRVAASALLREHKVDEAFELVLSAMDAVLQKSRELELLVAKLRRERLGQHSERVNAAQLALLFEELQRQGDTAALVDAAAETRDDTAVNEEIQAAEDERREAAKEIACKQRKGRLSLSGAERKVHETELSEDERRCAQCGEPRQKIGEEIARRIEYIPGHFVQHEHRLSKYACASCRDGVVTAPGPQRVLERSIADASVLAQVVVSKYVDHMPLHRLHESYARTGASIPVSTLSDWTGGVADLVAPLVKRLEQQVLGAHVVRTDATGLKVLDPRSPANIQRGTIWVYLGDEQDVVFRYAETGDGASGPWEFLGGRDGPIQADGASVFDRLFNGQVASALEVGCLAHARRKLVALQDTDCRVAYPIRLIRRVYRLEYLADLKDCTPPDRAALRQARTLPIFEKLKRWAVVTHAAEPPSSDLARATAYMLNQWDALTRFLYDGLLSPDNNLTEQQLRAIALGRKNFLFAGSHEAARRAAVLYSITRTCALRGVEPLAYLTDVLPKLAGGWPHSRIDELLPGNWQPGPPPLAQ